MEEVHRELLAACMLGQREQALALLDLHPALLNAAWAGEDFEVALTGGEDYPFTIQEEDTALITASFGGDTDLVLALLERGADVNARNGDGVTSVSYASGNGDVAIITHLLDKGADLHASDEDGMTALHSAAVHDQPAA